MIKASSVGTNDTLQNKKQDSEHVTYVHIFFWFVLDIQKTSLTLRTPAKNPKTYQWPKFYQLVSVMMVKYRAKNEVWRYLLTQFAVSMDAYPNAKPSIIAKFSLDILKI